MKNLNPKLAALAGVVTEMNSKTPEQMLAEHITNARKVTTTMRTELDALIKIMPEALKPGFQKLYDSANEYLGSLGPMEQSQQAPNMAWAFAHLENSMARFEEMTGGLFAQIKSLTANNNTLTLEINGLKDPAKNVVLSKADYDAAILKATNEGRAAVLPEVLASRKLVIEQCGLPVPADAVLGLNATEYNAAFEQAKANLATLKGKGMAVGGKGDAFIKKHVWLGKTEFDGSLSIIADVLAPAAATETAPKTTPDPVLGAPGAGDGNKTVPKHRIPC